MLEQLLEILLITYNRNDYLDRTLTSIKDSPFAQCKITILDNCSTDNSYKTACKYGQYFSNYRVVRNNKNIGGDNNFLKAVEMATFQYVWILCDDDTYDFSYSDVVIAEIVSCKYDLIYVASRSKYQLSTDIIGATTVKKLFDSGAQYYRAVTFIPSIIFRPDQFDCYCFFQSSKLYPSVAFVNKTLRYDLPIYISKYELVVRNICNHLEMSPLCVFRSWVSSLDSINDKYYKTRTIVQFTDKGFLRSLGFWIALDRATGVEGYWKCIVDIMFGLTPLLRFKALLLIPLMLLPVPISFLRHARVIVYRMMGSKDTHELPPTDFIKR